MLLVYLVLALLSGVAPQGVPATGTVDAAVVALDESTLHTDHATAIQPAAPVHHQLPDSPAESEREEEEVREYESGPTFRTAAVRVSFSFLASYLVPSSCLPDPPNVVRAPKLTPAAGTTRTILHQVFRI